MATKIEDEQSVPDGFTEMNPYGPFHEMCGPMYHCERGENTVVAIRMTDKHRNAGQIVHGGMLLLLVDTAMTKACGRNRQPDQFYVTTNLTSELMSAARQATGSKPK